MKKTFLTLIGLSVIFASSCQKQLTPQADVNENTPPETEVSDAPRAVTFTASIPETKVSVATSGKTAWTAVDKIAVYNTEGTKYELSLTDGAGTSFGTFSGVIEGTLDDLAVFPASYAGDTKGRIVIPRYIALSDEIPLLMASSVTTGEESPLSDQLHFHHIAAVMEFTLQDLPAYACALKTIDASLPLSGTFTVNANLDGLTPVDGSTTRDLFVYFPYKTAYGAEETVQIFVPVPAGTYSNYRIRVVDGDEDPIEGTGMTVPAAYSTLAAGDYVAMPSVNVRSKVTRSGYVKVEDVKWATGNLRAWKSGTTGEGWQSGWNLYDHQWESQYMLLNDISAAEDPDNIEFSLNVATYKDGSTYTHWDYFSWGTIGRASRVHNQKVTSSVANFDICGKVFSGAATDISTLTELTGDDRFAANDFADSNPSLCGDLAFWASKGLYRLPHKAELNKLYAKNNAGAGSDYAHMQAGYYMAGSEKINGILFTSCPSWETTTYNETAVELTAADIESGLFLPKIGERTKNSTTSFDATGIKRFNNWGAYWSGTYGSLNAGYEDCVTAVCFAEGNAMSYGYTIKLSKTNCGQTPIGNAIRPVLVD